MVLLIKTGIVFGFARKLLLHYRPEASIDEATALYGFLIISMQALFLRLSGWEWRRATGASAALFCVGAVVLVLGFAVTSLFA